MKTINIGLIGLGVVGTGVAEILLKNQKEFAERYGLIPEIHSVAVRDPQKQRDVALDPGVYKASWQEVVKDPQVDIVVELIGGDSDAKEIVLEAFKQGKHVVTANKALLALHWEEVFVAAKQAKRQLKFEASVAGGVPVIKAINESLAANRIDSLMGIINGTCNYILTEMEHKAEQLEDVLKEAQAKGYAEADPSFDVGGIDAAHKLSILASLAFGVRAKLQNLHTEGICDLSLQDILYAQELGYVIRLLAIAKQKEGQVEVRVHPTLVHKAHAFAAVQGVNNAVSIRASEAGDILLSGAGAGRYPTASAVVADILDLLQLPDQQSCPDYYELSSDLSILPFEQVCTRYYLKCLVKDQPGVLSAIAQVLGEHQISIASVIQKEEEHGEYVPLVIMTHKATEANMSEARTKIAALANVSDQLTAIRVED